MGLLVSAKLNYDRTKSELKEKAFEQVLVNRTFEKIAERMDSLGINESQLGDLKTSDPASYQAYMQLQAAATTYELKGENLASEMELLEQQMDNYQDLMKNSVEDSTSHWCFGN